MALATLINSMLKKYFSVLDNGQFVNAICEFLNNRQEKDKTATLARIFKYHMSHSNVLKSDYVSHSNLVSF